MIKSARKRKNTPHLYVVTTTEDRILTGVHERLQRILNKLRWRAGRLPPGLREIAYEVIKQATFFLKRTVDEVRAYLVHVRARVTELLRALGEPIAPYFEVAV